jgi:hypothetical protein
MFHRVVTSEIYLGIEELFPSKGLIMKYLLTGVAAIALLTACGGKDKVETAGDTAVQEISASKGGDKLPKLKLRKGDAATAGQAITAFSLTNSGDGRVSFAGSDVKGDTATFTDITLTPEGEDDGTVTAGALKFEGLGMLNGQANFSRMTLSDISLNPPADEEGEGSGKIEAIQLVNPSPAMAAFVASLLGQGEPADLPEGRELSFDLWSMDALNFNVDTEDGEKGNFLINKIEVNNLQDEKAARMLLDGMTFDMYDPDEDTTVKANLGKIDVRGANLSWLTALQENAGDEDEMAAAFMQTLNQDPADPGYDNLTMSDLDIDVSGAKAVLSKLSSNVKRDKEGRAVETTTAPFKLTVSSGEGKVGEQLAGGLAMLGYEKLELSGEGHTKYDPETDIVSYVEGKNYYKLEDGFKLDISGKFEGLKAMSDMASAAAMDDDSTASEDVMENALENMVIHGFAFSLDDDGIVNRAFNAYAAQSGEDPQQVKNQLVGLMAMAPMMAAGSGVDASLVTEVTGALSSFITDPKTLTIAVAPQEPLRVSTLANMDDPSALTKAYLGLSATNE